MRERISFFFYPRCELSNAETNVPKATTRRPHLPVTISTVMTRRDLLRTCAAAPLAAAAYAQLRYQSTWESIDARPSPAWYTGAKFGIFIHWGVYSVPAYAPVRSKGETMYAEWYWNSLNKPDSSTRKFHDRVYGANFSYFDFAPMFKAELYDADHWADVFVRSGARY